MRFVPTAWLFVVTSYCIALPSYGLVILQYHHVSDSTPASTSTPPALFQQHLDIIAESDFEVLSLDTLTQLMRSNSPIPDKAVLITFDDSYVSIYETAFPLLKARGWPFVVFANTGPVASGGEFLSWAQFQEMAASGAAIANHSVDHTHFVRRPATVSADAWERQTREEILKAEKAIEQRIGQSHRVLAFPYGEFDARLLLVLEELDFLGMSQASGAVRGEDRLAMPRFPMGGRFGRLEDFTLKLNALPLPIDKVVIQDGEAGVLADGVLPDGISKPVLELKLVSTALAEALQCYASGQRDAISKIVADTRVLVQADKDLPAGRSRYNCTARDPDSGRYFWFSTPFLRRDAKGNYPPEA
ncbi:MAG: polysaccharide deacetylase family protein [Pseudomonadota bacterium]